MYYRSEILAGYDDQQEWSFCPEDPNDGTGTPCKTQAQYKKDLLPEIYPWALYAQLKIERCQRRMSLIAAEPDPLKHEERLPRNLLS